MGGTAIVDILFGDENPSGKLAQVGAGHVKQLRLQTDQVALPLTGGLRVSVCHIGVQRLHLD